MSSSGLISGLAPDLKQVRIYVVPSQTSPDLYAITLINLFKLEAGRTNHCDLQVKDAIRVTPAQLWRPGHCGVTSMTRFSFELCEEEEFGAWRIRDRETCVSQCEACARCHYVSWQNASGECSWYSDCNFDKLIGPNLKGKLMFVTTRVRGAGGDTKANNTNLSSLQTMMPSPRPSLLLFYHIPKTSGSAFMALAAHMAEHRKREKQPLWPSAVYAYGQHHCVLTHFPELFQVTARLSPALCGNRKLNWRLSNIVLEFHDRPSAAHFWSSVQPRLLDLRRTYAAEGGVVLVATTVREPLSQLVSTFFMWYARNPLRDGSPGCARNNITCALEHLPAWGGSNAAVALQSKHLVPESWMRPVEGCAGCCDAISVLARRRLVRTFDVVGITGECTLPFWKAVGARLEWNISQQLCNSVGASTLAHGPVPHIRAPEAVHRDPFRNISMSKRADVERAASCDHQLYEQARVVAGGGCNKAVPHHRSVHFQSSPHMSH